MNTGVAAGAASVSACRSRSATAAFSIHAISGFFLGITLALNQAHATEVALLDIKNLTLEELADIDVYSASRRLEPVQGTPGAIYVLTGEDIRRSHATNIPEALRLVPGVQVGRVDANKWAVSIRGFNSREANKLLVLVDGRSIYDPFFSGVFWESQDVMLEDVDRIEVIRGPGGTLWGANAVNGVINIITRHARDTQGGLVTATAGNELRYVTGARYGWLSGENQHARIYAKSFGRDTGFLQTYEPHDQSRMQRGGFRWDWHNNERDEIRVSGDVFNADTGTRENATLVQDTEHRGSNLVMRWDRRFSATHSMYLQYYYDHVGYNSVTFDQKRDTHDLEFQQSLAPWSQHVLVWGLGYRRSRDDTASGLSGFVDLVPNRRDDRMYNVFLQDTIALEPDKWHLTLGIKYENTDYADAEWLPNLRLAWTPDPQQTWWAAASRASRVPSRVEADLTFFNTLRIGDNMEPEHVNAYEFGYRRLVSARFWYDVAVFHNNYDDLRTSETGGQLRNFMHGHTYGFELASRWQPRPVLRVDTAYTYLTMDLALDATSTSSPTQLGYIEGLAPHHQFVVRTALDLSRHLEFDAALRYVDELRTLNYAPYTELDLGLSWRPRADLELSLVGQNLLDGQHPEQAFAFSSSGLATEVERSYHLKATWQF